MSAVGKWEIDVVVDGMPQKVATAMAELAETMIGAEYMPIAYLGSQVVNGTNHAVLAEQTVVTGRDTKNVVLLVFNEKPGDMKATLVGIDRIVESGGELGGISVDVKTDIPADAKAAWDNAFDGFVGANVKPFALLATQVVNGVSYTFAASFEPVVLDAKKNVVLVTINNVMNIVQFANIMDSRHKASLGYAFTW